MYEIRNLSFLTLFTKEKKKQYRRRRRRWWWWWWWYDSNKQTQLLAYISHQKQETRDGTRRGRRRRRRWWWWWWSELIWSRCRLSVEKRVVGAVCVWGKKGRRGGWLGWKGGSLIYVPGVWGGWGFGGRREGEGESRPEGGRVVSEAEEGERDGWLFVIFFFSILLRWRWQWVKSNWRFEVGMCCIYIKLCTVYPIILPRRAYYYAYDRLILYTITVTGSWVLRGTCLLAPSIHPSIYNDALLEGLLHCCKRSIWTWK